MAFMTSQRTRDLRGHVTQIARALQHAKRLQGGPWGKTAICDWNKQTNDGSIRQTLDRNA